jgi:hypothetical protein
MLDVIKTSMAADKSYLYVVRYDVIEVGLGVAFSSRWATGDCLSRRANSAGSLPPLSPPLTRPAPTPLS